ncbi:MAG: uridine kinase [Candidatus Pacebacteria bacterium]|nr:uridine kinase [Candidatus Paceibacterota bacterium]
MSSSKKPFIIGVAGGSGSGKTTIVENLIKVLGDESVTCISHDDYYRNQDHLPMKERVKTNYDHPDSLETDLLITKLKGLTAGKAVKQPIYDFVNHTRSKQTTVLQPNKVIIIEGILIFEPKRLRDLMDLKVFVDTEDDIRIIRRIKRDIEERGRTLDFVVDQYLKFTKPMHEEFVEPNKRYADIIIPEGGRNNVALDLLLTKVNTLL